MIIILINLKLVVKIKLVDILNETSKYMFKRMCSMVVKTLTIKEKAYDALYGLKRENESFSDVILRLSEEKKGNITPFFGCLADSGRSAKEWKEEIYARRKKVDDEVKKRMVHIQKRFS